jgi:hypothetical protein
VRRWLLCLALDSSSRAGVGPSSKDAVASCGGGGRTAFFLRRPLFLLGGSGLGIGGDGGCMASFLGRPLFFFSGGSLRMGAS